MAPAAGSCRSTEPLGSSRLTVPVDSLGSDVFVVLHINASAQSDFVKQKKGPDVKEFAIELNSFVPFQWPCPLAF